MRASHVCAVAVLSSASHSRSRAGQAPTFSPCALNTARRLQSQSYRSVGGTQWQEGHVDPRYSSAQNMRTLNADTMPHYVKATIQNDRREMGLGEVYDWAEFAKDAIFIPTRSGALWVGADDPRAAKLMRRREKMKQKPLQKARRKVGPDPAKALEDHPLREYYTTATNLHDPLSVANNLLRAGMIAEYDVKHTAAKIEYTPRAPIVSIMGHVDHGKTTLLDYLRQTNVASQEAGGITQNVGAFQVKTTDRHFVTFIDTPGHAAFTAMREVGASANDIIVLVVSAVDGVQPQTVEVIDLAHRLGIPLVVAITKIDREPNVAPVKQQLREHAIELEEDGGDVQCVAVCGRDGTGIPALLEALQLQAELCEIATPEPSRAELVVLESQSKDVSEIAAVVRCGHVRPGQVLVTGMMYGTVRKLFDEHGEPLSEAGPSTPVVLHGLKSHPKPGSTLLQVSSDAHAQKYFQFMKEVFEIEGGRENYLQLLNQEASGQFYSRKPDNNLVREYSTQSFVVSCKAATFGMLQAMMKMIYDLPRLEGVSMEMKITEVGGLRDYDVALIGSSGQPGCILLFGDCKDTAVLEVPNHVHVLRFNVLYHGIEELKRVLVESLPKIKKMRVLASAECLSLFRASQAGRTGNAGGMKVTKGMLEANHLHYRVLRKAPPSAAAAAAARRRVSTAAAAGPSGEKKTATTAAGTSLDEEDTYSVVYEGQLKELRRFKDLVPSVETGLECGVILHDEFAFKIGDRLEMIEHYEEARDVEEEFEAAAKREKIMRDMSERQAQHDATASLEDPAAGVEKLSEKLTSIH